MFSSLSLEKEKRVLEFVNKSTQICKTLFAGKFKHLDVDNYKYTTEVAVEELGLDDELVNQLVEDHVIQIIKSEAMFLEYLDILKKQKDEDVKLDYTDFRELAHKNLGVARNLRIEDAQKLIHELMTKDDLDYLGECLEALRACTIKLKPKLAYETMQLIKIKSSL
jgi:HPt (histidine-containing phosphotransfer) domain-containing protein